MKTRSGSQDRCGIDQIQRLLAGREKSVEIPHPAINAFLFFLLSPDIIGQDLQALPFFLYFLQHFMAALPELLAYNPAHPFWQLWMRGLFGLARCLLRFILSIERLSRVAMSPQYFFELFSPFLAKVGRGLH